MLFAAIRWMFLWFHSWAGGQWRQWGKFVRWPVGGFPGMDLWEVAANTAQDRTATAGQGEAEVKLSAGEIQRASGHFCLFPAQLAGSL